MKQPILTFIGVLLLFSCETNKLSTAGAEDIGNIYLFQNGKEKRLFDFEKAVGIERKAFSLRFFCKQYNRAENKFHSIRIAAFLDRNDLNSIKKGMKVDEITCFSPGSGLSSGRDGYKSLYFTNYGHHYLFYENGESNRLDLIKKQGEYLKLEFNISSFWVEQKEISINDFEPDIFYLVILKDLNLNGFVEDNELTKITFVL